MKDHDADTDPTVPRPSNQVTKPLAASGAVAPEPVTAATAAPGKSGADEVTRVRAQESAVRVGSDGVLGLHGYELSREIARGGMGVVYAARDLSLDREVAVKVMLPNMNAAEFVRESRVTARLPHPGVPPVYTLGTLPAPDGRPFLAMKLIKGETLDKLLKAQTDAFADRGRFVAAFEQMCQAVGYAHAQGIVHRDLKPSNVMVGAFGEVQIMDWGLAKVVGSADPDPTGPDWGAAIQDDIAATVAGQVKGTPSYMAPEQARGEPVDSRADVFALGGILAVVLTGQPPFVGNSVLDTIIRAGRAELDDVLAQLDGSGADPELIALAKKCLAGRAEDRPTNAQEVAEAVSRYRAGVDARLQQAERDRAVSVAESREQRKRWKVQLTLAGVVAAMLAGAGIATNLVLKKQAEEQLAAEQKRLTDLRAADDKAAADLRAADDKAKRAQRETKCDALVGAIKSATTPEVPRLIDELKEFGDLSGPKLRELAGRPVETKPGLHGRLALLAEEPACAGELAAYLPTCKPEELLPVAHLLKPHTVVAPMLWAVLLDAKSDSAKRVRAACALAGLTPENARWKSVAGAVVDAVVKANPSEFVVWSAALDPVRGVMVPELSKRYPAARVKIESGKLAVSELAGEVSSYDLTANLLARYTKDRPADLAELALTADPRHYALFADALAANKLAVVPVLRAELAKQLPQGSPNDTLDAALEAHAKRRGYAAAVLFAFGEAESVWPVFVFPKDGDPTARSYLQERLAAVGADPGALVKRFGTEVEVSAKRGLLIALGDFPAELVPAGEREPFVSRLLSLYRHDPDSGLHSAIDWLLRQKWGKANELAVIDLELAREARGRVVARVLAGAGMPVGVLPGVVGPQLPAPVVVKGKDWYVNGEGQTFAVVRGPVEFTLGSPLSEPGRIEVNEPPHRKRIGRTFAIATKEVTVAEYLRFSPKYEWAMRFSPGPDTPAVAMTWYEAAEYCNWLSAREGIPPDQWCYEPTKAGGFDEGMRMKTGHLILTGYRLPTEAEWEYACRSGAGTSRCFGRGEGLLPRYGWFAKNAQDRAWPVGQLRPNDRGLFDNLGNAMEWVEDPAQLYVPRQNADIENVKLMSIDERMSRILRGGSFFNLPVFVRCAYRDFLRPGNRSSTNGFRPLRTLPE